MPENVTYGFGYIRYIKSKKQRILSPVEVNEIINKIETGRLNPSFKTHQEHVIHVHKIKSEKQNGVICPQCGAIMVMRESKKGESTGKQFWGCSRFPKCRGVVNIT
jgi:ssDNA-binding Zn-finger/Zn-ribbon topoisomerase 1